MLVRPEKFLEAHHREGSAHQLSSVGQCDELAPTGNGLSVRDATIGSQPNPLGTGVAMTSDRPAKESTRDVDAATDWYPQLLSDVSSHISTGRRRAVAAANAELVTTYWAIGREIAAREGREGWGSKVVLQL